MCIRDSNCTTLLTIIAVLLTLIVSVFGQSILMAFGASENTIGYAWEYMQIYAIGTIFVQLALGLNAFINAQGFARIGMITVVIGAVCNIVLDPIFMFIFGMGVRGAALATILSQAVSCVWILRFLTSDKSHLRIRRKYLLLRPRIFLPAVALGLSLIHILPKMFCRTPIFAFTAPPADTRRRAAPCHGSLPSRATWR